MDIQHLRDLTQKEKIEGRTRPWGYAVLQRGPSIYITHALLPTRVTPTMVTAIGLLFGILGALLLTSISWGFKLFGLFFVYQNILADKVDGELARARGTHSLRGVYLDELNHLIIPPLIFAGLIYGLLPTAGGEQPLLALALLIGPIALATTRAMHNIAPALYTKKMLKYGDRFMERPTGVLPQNDAESDTKSVGAEHAGFTQNNAETTTHASSILLIPIRVLHQFQDLLVFTVSIFILIVIDSVRASSPLITLSVYPLTTYATIALAFLYAAIVIENAIKGYRGIENKMSQISTRQASL